MLLPPVVAIAPNTPEFENVLRDKPTGFRGYDAHWSFGRPDSDVVPEFDVMGATAVGLDRLLADLHDELPKTWSSPTLSGACSDGANYEVPDQATRWIAQKVELRAPVAGQPSPGVVNGNGVLRENGDVGDNNRSI
jgi:hypothetical protein